MNSSLIKKYFVNTVHKQLLVTIIERGYDKSIRKKKKLSRSYFQVAFKFCEVE